jgi:hypothetical protein
MSTPELINISALLPVISPLPILSNILCSLAVNMIDPPTPFFAANNLTY